jgi:uncharacterized protein YoxC
MEMDDVIGNAGSPPATSPALSTRLQQKRRAREKNGHVGAYNEAETGEKIDFLVKTVLNLQRSQEKISKQCLDLQHQNESLQHQSESLQHQNESLKHQNDTLQNEIHSFQNEIQNLQNEVKDLREQVSNLSTLSLPQTSQASPSSGEASHNRSWSSLFPNNSSVSPNSSASRQEKRKPFCVRISTPWNPSDTNAGDNLARYQPLNAASNRIKEALQEDNATQNVQVAGVGSTNQGYLIRFKDKQSADAAKHSTGWLEQLGHGIKIETPKFGVVVHRTPTNEITFTDDKSESIAKITGENELATKGFKIENIAWLKRKDSPLGARASLGIWFDSVQAAEWAINDGMLFGYEYVGSVEAYETKRKRCYNCQAFGHLARNCRENSRCAHCAMEHDSRDCPPGSIPRCADCNERHPTGSRECRGPIHA